MAQNGDGPSGLRARVLPSVYLPAGDVGLRPRVRLAACLSDGDGGLRTRVWPAAYLSDVDGDLRARVRPAAYLSDVDGGLRAQVRPAAYLSDGDGGLRAHVRPAAYLSDGDGGRVSRRGRDAVLLREGHLMLRVNNHPHARLLRQLAKVLVLFDVQDQLQRCNKTWAYFIICNWYRPHVMWHMPRAPRLVGPRALVNKHVYAYKSRPRGAEVKMNPSKIVI